VLIGQLAQILLIKYLPAAQLIDVAPVEEAFVKKYIPAPVPIANITIKNIITPIDIIFL
jgi:hypothetical protein